MAFWQWSKTAANNATAAPAINWREGQAPGSVNDSSRSLMAETAAYRDDISGSILTGGTSTAYTVTSNQGFDSIAHMDAALICFVPHTTNGASPTLSIDGLAARPIRSAPATDIAGGVLVQGTPYAVTYNNSDGAFYLHSFFGAPVNLFQIPLGALLPHTSTVAPNSNFVLPFGQAISRTTYAAYFALPGVGTTYGIGDNVTTFNVPDLRGRGIFGIDNMGGSTASRITNAGSGIVGTTLGAAGGAQNVTLDATMIPAHTHPSPTLTDPGHAHTYAGPGGSNAYAGTNGGFISLPTSTNTTGITLSATTGSTGGGLAHNNMPPTIMLNWILRIL